LVNNNNISIMEKWDIFINKEKVRRVNIKLAEIAEAILSSDIQSKGLLGGDVGLILFLYNYVQYTGQYDLMEKISDRLLLVCDDVTNRVNTFCSGLAGLGWLLQHLHNHDVLGDDLDFIMNDVDRLLENWMIWGIQKGNYDFLHGSMGAAFYFQSRNNDRSNQSISLFMDILESKGIKDGEQSIKWQSNKRSRLVYDFGLAHGMASIVSFLTNLSKNDIHRDNALKLLAKIVRYLIRNMNPKHYKSSFSSSVYVDNENYNESRLAWCYGDLGTAYSLYRASIVLNDLQLKELSITALKKTTNRKNIKAEIVHDSCFCHGSSGIMHIYNRMYQHTLDPVFKRAMEFWLDVTLSKSKTGEGPAGYQFFNPKEDTWVDEYSILNGVAGIGLALIATVYSSEPLWDECLLLS
jgi:lantibiotic modifying enzyme